MLLFYYPTASNSGCDPGLQAGFGSQFCQLRFRP